jgi:2,4-dienoyl-CoA reductase (NADPH2)
VHEEGGKILMQILHAGRYGYSPSWCRRRRNRRSRRSSRALSERGIERTIRDYARCARWRARPATTAWK